jgi:hypothetical protein
MGIGMPLQYALLLDVENDDRKLFCSKTYWNGLYDSPCAGQFSISLTFCLSGGYDGMSGNNST